MGELKPNPRNPNTHPQRQIELLAKNIRYFGWRQTITVSKLRPPATPCCIAHGFHARPGVSHQGTRRSDSSIRSRRSGTLQTPGGTKPGTGGGTGGSCCWAGRKKAPPCDEPGFLAAQVFAIASETGWPEERILFMPLARLAQYQHCLLRRNGAKTHWSSAGDGVIGLREQLQALRGCWIGINSD